MHTRPPDLDNPERQIVVTDWASLERKWPQFNFAMSVCVTQDGRNELACEIDQFITRIGADNLISRNIIYITILLGINEPGYGSEIYYSYDSTLAENIQRICGELSIPLPAGHEPSIDRTMHIGPPRSPRATIPVRAIDAQEISGTNVAPEFEAILDDERPSDFPQLDEIPQGGILTAMLRGFRWRYLVMALGLAGAALFITKTRSTTSDERPNTSMGTSAPAAPKTKSAPPVPPNKWQYSRDCSVRFTQGVGHRILCEYRTDYDITPKVETLGRDTGEDGNTSRMIVVSFKHPPGITLPAASCASLPFRIAEGLSGLYRDVLFRCVDEQSPK